MIEILISIIGFGGVICGATIAYYSKSREYLIQYNIRHYEETITTLTAVLTKVAIQLDLLDGLTQYEKNNALKIAHENGISRGIIGTEGQISQLAMDRLDEVNGELFEVEATSFISMPPKVGILLRKQVFSSNEYIACFKNLGVVQLLEVHILELQRIYLMLRTQAYIERLESQLSVIEVSVPWIKRKELSKDVRNSITEVDGVIEEHRKVLNNIWTDAGQQVLDVYPLPGSAKQYIIKLIEAEKATSVNE